MMDELFPVEAPAHRPRRRPAAKPAPHHPASAPTADLFELAVDTEFDAPGSEATHQDADAAGATEPDFGQTDDAPGAAKPEVALQGSEPETELRDAPEPEAAPQSSDSATTFELPIGSPGPGAPKSEAASGDSDAHWIAEAEAGVAAADSGRAFDLCGELPAGTTVLEASAGTGKTYAIVGLAVRFVAEGAVDVSELLLVTFSRAATQELRERARDRFVAAAAGLADPESAQRSDDELIRHLAQGDSARVNERRLRLLAALSEFDSGTIATTHSFCQRMLDELGLAGEHDPGIRMVEDVDDLVATVAEDLFLARYARATPPFELKDARALAIAAVRDRHARLVPEVEDGDDQASERVSFATAVRAETERRKRLSGIRDFDDLLVLLHDVLADPVHGERARRRIRDRFRVALVDEFQDTDPLQWEILRGLFHGHRTLVLVGDPKQAIYAFRGAEVLSYLDAVAHANQRRELTVNRRSDAGLLAALDHVMGGATLGHKEIAVHPVRAVRPYTRLRPAEIAGESGISNRAGGAGLAEKGHSGAGVVGSGDDGGQGSAERFDGDIATESDHPGAGVEEFRGDGELQAVGRADGRVATENGNAGGAVGVGADARGSAGAYGGDGRRAPRTGSDPQLTPLRLRCFPRKGAGPLNKPGFPAVGRQRSRVAQDVAADIVRLLDSGVLIEERPVGPGDIAVLVRTRSQIDVVRAALDEVGVASVLAGGASVFATQSAVDWLWLLRALEQPHRADRVRLAAATPLLGYAAAEIDSGGADLVGRLAQQLRESARMFGRTGFAAVFERLAAEARLAPRLLAVAGGERRLTDLRHIAQLLDQAALRESLGLSALTRWLGDRVRDPASGAVADRSRRLDRDAAAVQIATVHASKGLEFPIVYLPFAWDNARNPYPATLAFHADDGARVLDVGGPDARGYNDRKRRSEAEEAGEELRLLYVALTRAQCQVVAWWAPTYGTGAAPLHRMILGRMPGSPEVPGRSEVPVDGAVLEQLSQWAATAPGEVIALEPVERVPAVRPRWDREDSGPAEFAAARFDRTVDQDWRRTSYSALTAGAHDLHAAAAEEPGGITDEPEAPAAEFDEIEFDSAAPSLMNDLPYGADFGTLVHGVLEYVDTDAPDLAAEVRSRCAAAVADLMADIDLDQLTTSLLAVLRTPLGPACDGIDMGTLARISGRDRLNELDFELPLAGGDNPVSERVTVRRIADLLRTHLRPDDVFAAYADQIDTLPDTPLRGFLTGSIDAVLRTAGPRFVVVDYKTNRLGTGDLTVAHYTRDRMAAEMMRSHYPLQGLLYSAALHRYLRWRMPAYDPNLHLGGIRYLFVRGMIGAETPSGHGVFDWDPPVTLVEDLSDLLAGELGRREAR